MDESTLLVSIRVILIFLIFALGIPGFLIQNTIPDDIKQIITRRSKIWGRLAFGGIVLLCFSALTLILLLILLNPPTFLLSVIEHYSCFINSFVARIPIGVIILVLLYWLRIFLRPSVRTQVIKYFRKKICHNFKKHFYNVKNDTRDLIRDFIFLGENSRAGYEKELILETIREVVDPILNETPSRSNYYTERLLSELEYIVLGISRVLINGPHFANDDNFSDGLRILNSIQRFASQEEKAPIQLEISLSEELSRLAITLLKHKRHNIFLICVEMISTKATKHLFEIGKLALTEGEDLSAVMTLDRIDDQLNSSGKIPLSKDIIEDDETCIFFLGLLSHFWCAKGSAQSHALEYTNNLKDYFQSNKQMLVCLNFAKRHLRNLPDFETSDKVQKMLNDLSSMAQSQ